MNLIRKIYSLLKDRGLFGFLKFFFIRITSKICAVPIALGIICISPFIRIRLIQLFSTRVGHYSFNTEAILCGLDLNLDNDKKYKTFFYTLPGALICNTQLHTMWKRVITIVPLSTIALEVDRLLKRYGSKKYRHDPIKRTFEPGCDGRDRWSLLKRVNQCHLSFTPDEHRKAQLLLEKLGIPRKKPFVCLLVRDPQYLNSYIPSGNWSYHDYRDADVNSYQLAAQYLADQGYYVIRMGKIVKDPFYCNHSKIIDYALSSLRSDFLDMYLSAHCYFFISTCTGLDSVARTFRKPLLVTNLGLPDFDIWHPWDLFIPKKIQDVNTGSLLTFAEMNDLYQAMSHKSAIMNQLTDKGLQFVDNTSDEIKAVTQEMLGRLDGSWQYTQEDERLQHTFWDVFPKYLVSDVLPTLNIPVNEKICMRVGCDFLKSNVSLFSNY